MVGGALARGEGYGFSRPGPLRLTQLEFKCWPLLSLEWPGVSTALGLDLHGLELQPWQWVSPFSPIALSFTPSSRQPSWVPSELCTCCLALVLSVLEGRTAGHPTGPCQGWEPHP